MVVEKKNYVGDNIILLSGVRTFIVHISSIPKVLHRKHLFFIKKSNIKLINKQFKKKLNIILKEKELCFIFNNYCIFLNY
jgi:hypothetical protein